jgi:hypothetical protein
MFVQHRCGGILYLRYYYIFFPGSLPFCSSSHHANCTVHMHISSYIIHISYTCVHTYIYLHTYHTYIKGPTQSHNRIITIRPCPKRLATAHSPLPKEAHHGSQQISSFNCLLFLALKDLLSANKRTRVGDSVSSGAGADSLS